MVGVEVKLVKYVMLRFTSVPGRLSNFSCLFGFRRGWRICWIVVGVVQIRDDLSVKRVVFFETFLELHGFPSFLINRGRGRGR